MPGSGKPRGPALPRPRPSPALWADTAVANTHPVRQLEPRTLPPCSLANKPQLAGGKGRESLSTEPPRPSRGRVWGWR